MDEEMGFALDSIRQAIKGEQPYGLTRVLFETVDRESWALFRLDNNSPFDDTLPRWNAQQAHGNFYVFFYNVPRPGISVRDMCTFSAMSFFESDVSAVRWAFGLAKELIPVMEDAQEPCLEPDEFDEAPF